VKSGTDRCRTCGRSTVGVLALPQRVIRPARRMHSSALTTGAAFIRGDGYEPARRCALSELGTRRMHGSRARSPRCRPMRHACSRGGYVSSKRIRACSISRCQRFGSSRRCMSADRGAPGGGVGSIEHSAPWHDVMPLVADPMSSWLHAVAEDLDELRRCMLPPNVRFEESSRASAYPNETLRYACCITLWQSRYGVESQKGSRPGRSGRDIEREFALTFP